MVFILSLSNLGTGLAAARIAKDTSVDNDGVLHVKNSDSVVTTVGMGKETHISITKGSPEQLQGSTMCIDVDTASTIWQSTMAGVKTTALVTYPESATGEISPQRGLSFNPNGALFNETHACVPIDGQEVALCLDFTMDECDEIEGGTRRGLRGDGPEITHHMRRDLLMMRGDRKLLPMARSMGGRIDDIKW